MKAGLGLGVAQASTELEEVEAASDVEGSADSVVDWVADPVVADSVTEVEEADSVVEADVADSVDDTAVVDSVESVVKSALDTVVEAVSEITDSVEDATSVVALDSVTLEVSDSVSVDVSVTVDDSDRSEEVTEVEVADDTVTTEEDPTKLQLARQICAMKHSLLTRLWLAWRGK